MGAITASTYPGGARADISPWGSGGGGAAGAGGQGLDLGAIYSEMMQTAALRRQMMAQQLANSQQTARKVWSPEGTHGPMAQAPKAERAPEDTFLAMEKAKRRAAFEGENDYTVKPRSMDAYLAMMQGREMLDFAPDAGKKTQGTGSMARG
jgi:hypothetical protein